LGKSIKFLVLLCILLGSLVQAEAPIPLASEEDKIAFLSHLQKTIPGLFDQSIRYDIDLFHMLESQAALQGELQSLPSYADAVARKRPGLDIDIQVTKPSATLTRQIKPEAVDQWRKKLLKTLESVPAPEAIETEISEISKAISKRTSNGLITGLIQSHFPRDHQIDLFRLSRSEQIEALGKNLPDKLSSKFKSDIFQLTDSSKSEALKLIGDLNEKENRIKELLELHVVLQNADGKIVGEKEAQAEALRSLTVQDLTVFVDPDALGTRVKRLPIKETKQMMGDIQRSVKAFSDQTETVSETSSGELRLRQMGPETAIFRGCTGGDCSSSMSFPYPNDPHEKVFFLFDEKNELKGYLSGTLLKSGDVSTFYVISINGPRLSESVAKQALQGLYKERKNLGADQIAITTQADGVFSNYPGLVSLHSELAKGRPKINIQYNNPEIRSVIEKHKSDNNSADYDHMAQNRQAFLYEPKPQEMETLNIKSQEQKPTKYSSTIDRDTVALAALKMRSTRPNDTIRLFSGIGVPKDNTVAYMQALKNLDRRSIQGMKDHIAEMTNQLQIPLKSLEAVPGIFSAGYLNASDIAEEKNRDLAFQSLDSHLGSGNDKARQLARSNFPLLRSKTMNDYLTSIIREERLDLPTLALLLNGAPTFKPEPEVVKQLFMRMTSPTEKCPTKLMEAMTNWAEELIPLEGMMESAITALEALPQQDWGPTEDKRLLSLRVIEDLSKKIELEEKQIKRIVESALARYPESRGEQTAFRILNKYISDNRAAGDRFARYYLHDALGTPRMGRLYTARNIYPLPNWYHHQLADYISSHREENAEVVSALHVLERILDQGTLPTWGERDALGYALVRVARDRNQLGKHAVNHATRAMAKMYQKGYLSNEFRNHPWVQESVNGTIMWHAIFPEIQQIVGTMNGQPVCFNVSIKIGN
jgi:hypothetical protein